MALDFTQPLLTLTQTAEIQQAMQAADAGTVAKLYSLASVRTSCHPKYIIQPSKYFSYADRPYHPRPAEH